MTRRLPVPADRVWEVMAAPGALVRYHPFCSANPVLTWPGIGAQDAIHYLSGLILYRRFTAWREGDGYELEIGNAEWPISRVQWNLEATGPSESALSIGIWPTAFSSYPSVVRRALYRWYLGPLLRRYLRAVLRGLEFYLGTGLPVAPNQFGRIWLFSYGLTPRT